MSSSVNADNAVPPMNIENLSYTIEPLTPQHAADAARLHIAGQPGTFLTRLGPDVLTIIYETLPTTAGGFGFAAVDDVQSLLGFVSATTSVGKLFVQTGFGKAGSLLPAVGKRMLKQPGLLLLSAKTVVYPFMVRHNDDDDDRSGDVAGVELLSIMVSADYRGHGIGAQLMDALLHECRRRNIAAIDVTVDAANPGARNFYVQQGFSEQKTFHMYGRDMCQYGRSIQQQVLSARLHVRYRLCITTIASIRCRGETCLAR